MRWFDRRWGDRRLNRAVEEPSTEVNPGGPRVSAVTAWALAHGVPYSIVVDEFLEQVGTGQPTADESEEPDGRS